MEKIELFIFINFPEILVCAGVVFIIQRIFFIKNSIETLGVISEVNEFQVSQSQGSKFPNAQRKAYYSDIQFKDEAGRIHLCIPFFGRQLLSIRVGDQVPILYKKV